MRVLLTGSFGNVGGHTTTELLRQGHQVRAFDRRTTRTEQVAQRFGSQIEFGKAPADRNPLLTLAKTGS